jgi:hypothetical protein
MSYYLLLWRFVPLSGLGLPNLLLPYLLLQPSSSESGAGWLHPSVWHLPIYFVVSPLAFLASQYFLWDTSLSCYTTVLTAISDRCLNARLRIPVATRSKAKVCCRLVVGIAGLNPAEGMYVCLLCLYVVLSCVDRGLCDGLMTRSEKFYRVSNSVWLRNLNSEEDKARLGL